MVQLNFPEQMELNLLIQYVSDRLGIKILYDQEVANQQITIRAPREIPVRSLLGLLESALRMKGLAIADATEPGWKKIVRSADLAKIARPSEEKDLSAIPASAAVTQAFELRSIDPQRLTQLIQPFLTEQGANVITLQEQNLLIVTDFAENVRKIAGLIETIDRVGPATVVRFYAARHVETAALAQQLSQIMSAKAHSAGLAEAAGLRTDITQDERTNQLVVVGTEERVAEALKLAEELDVPLDQKTQVYSMRFVDAERIDRLVREMLDPATAERQYRSVVDREENLLIVTAAPAVQERVEWFRRALDVQEKRPASAAKFYRLKNSNVAEVLQTLLAIQREQGAGGVGQRGVRGVSPVGRTGFMGTDRFGIERVEPDRFVPGPNVPVEPGREELPTTPALRPEEPLLPGGEFTPQGLIPGQPTGSLGGLGSGIVPGAARLTADPSSNTLIVVADRATQEIYAELIEFLDRRRPQVMIEAKVVIIDTSDDYSIGVEISLGDRQGIKRLLEFTSFGLSQVSPVTGALAIIPGRGFNWTLVDPDVADAVLRALATHRRARLVSAPKVMVNDNATGTLASVAEVPFTSVNASQTVATTSFAGFAEAGTTIEVTPRISDDDYLQLDFVVSLNSFTGTGGEGIPPPRQTDEVTSSVTVPDGHTIIVGGLTRKNASLAVDGVPFLENIPVIRELTQLTVESHSQTTLYVFLRPVILRDDKFEFLKFLSERDAECAGLCGDFPQSAPLTVR